MALDLPLPKQVFGHPWLLQGGDKMSKSKGNVIYADDMVRLFGVDATRYFVLHEMPFENDGVISWELMVERMNSDLANILGNLVNRTISMSNKYFGGEVADKGAAGEADADLKATVLEAVKRVDEKMDKLREDNMLEFEKILTPEQKEKLKDIKARHHEEMKKRHEARKARHDMRRDRHEKKLLSLIHISEPTRRS